MSNELPVDHVDFDENIREYRCYRGNRMIKRAGVPIEWTPEMMEELLKCSEDVIYFTEKYMKILVKGKGLQPIKLFPYQKDMIMGMKNNRFNIFATARQAGKCCGINTPIKLRNKKTGEVWETTIGEFFEIIYKAVHGVSQGVSDPPQER